MKRLMLTCSAPRSTLRHLTLIASSITPLPWCPLSGALSAKIEVSAWVYFPEPRFCGLFAFVVLNDLSIDPARYSIIHDIYQHPASAAESSSVPEQGYLILSVEYQFRYPDSPYSSPQLSPIDSLSSANSSLPSPSSFNGVSFLLSSATYPARLTGHLALVRIPPQLLACSSQRATLFHTI